MVKLAKLYFDITHNKDKLGTVGHPEAEYLGVTLAAGPDGTNCFASAIVRESGKQMSCFWQFESPIGPTDEVRIVHTSGGTVLPPSRRFEMGRAARQDWSDSTCDFCHQDATQAARLFPGDASRPTICSECVETRYRALHEIERDGNAADSNC
ncbi:MAG: hypothetical protein K1X53_05000 [Candidatus Sumerlaeaceae bacterium]|nr:hypothetical protein [Candidatus Sumerlaeaceae bacterium]